MFGFVSDESITSTNIISEIPIDMTKQQGVYIHSSLLKRRMAAIDNNLESKFVESDVICKIGLTSIAPYDDLLYNESSENHFSYHLAMTKIQSIRLWVTDENNEPLALTRDYTMTIKFNFIPNDIPISPELKVLMEIKDFIHYYLLANDKHLNKIPSVSS